MFYKDGFRGAAHQHCLCEQDSKMEDSAQIVKALAVHRFCGDKVRVIVEVLEPETQTSTVWDETRKGGIEIICPVKIHYKMIARRSVTSSLSISSLSFSHCSSIISCMCKSAWLFFFNIFSLNCSQCSSF